MEHVIVLLQVIHLTLLYDTATWKKVRTSLEHPENPSRILGLFLLEEGVSL